MRKAFILLIFIFTFSLVSCTTPVAEGYVRLPRLTNNTREEISKKLDKLNIRYQFRVNTGYYNENEYDMFIEYGQGLKYGDIIPEDSFVYIFTTPTILSVNNLDQASIDFEYENLDFSDDGIGEVTLNSTIDGDTANFRDQDGSYIRVRFLGIDTPETKNGQEAWGQAASTYTSNLLKNATKIVLESEENRFDTYGRYLAFVWVDGKLLNLDIIQQAYSNSTLGSKSKYFDLFTETEIEVAKSGRRIWGELDPNYNYETHRFK